MAGTRRTTTPSSASRATRRRRRSRRPTASWPASCTPTSTRTRRSGSRRSPRPTRCSPTRRSASCTTSAATRSPPAAASGRASASPTSWTPSSAPEAARGRGPRPRQRRGQDALIRVEIDLAEATFGATRDLQVDTAVVCPTCHGAGTRPGTSPRTCDVCRGRGEVQQVTRSFLGQVMTSRPCAACQGFGTVIPDPCHECGGDGRVRTRRTLTVKIPPGVDTGTRIQLAGEGEAGPGGGPAGDLFVEIVETAAPRCSSRQGDDLHCNVSPCPMTAAALGTTVTHRDPRRAAAGRAARRARSPARPSTLTGLGVTHLRSPGPRRPGRARRGRDADPARRRAGGAAAQAGRPARRGRPRRRHRHRTAHQLLRPAARRLQRAAER